MVDLRGLRVLVTGATGGIGTPTAELLARGGATVLAHGRDHRRVAALVKALPGAEPFVADLESLAGVRRLAAEVTSAGPVDVLINNAGIGFGADRYKRETSLDGFELRFAINYLAPFVLSRALVPRKAVVNVASAGQLELRLDDLQSTFAYDGVEAYRRSKLALIMLTLDQAKAGPVPSLALHPGTFLDTGMVRDAGIPPQGTAKSGAEAILYVLERALAGVTGIYFDVKSESHALPSAYDEATRRSLREQTETLLAKA